MHSDPREQFSSSDDMAAWIETTLADLPFCVDTESDESPANFWNVDPVGHAEIDHEVGAQIALQAIRYSLKYSLPVLITRMIESIVRSGRIGPTEIGFLSVISRKATVGSQN